MPIGVFAVYGALVIWAGLLAYGTRRGAWRPFLFFGIAFLLALNVGYFVNGAPYAISFFVSIYDVLDNLGVDPSIGAAALGPCEGNACTRWGETYELHPTWGVSFYERFASGDQFRTNLLYGHIAFNSAAFVLMHVQFFKPGYGVSKRRHAMIGKVVFAATTVATICAIWLASQHGDVASYGGSMSSYGFYFMSLCVYACIVLGAITARRGDTAAHRVWMIRYIGAMWGSFWLFRVMLFVLGPLLRDYDAAAIQICIWFSAPLGILIAEALRRRADARISATNAAIAAE